MAIFGLIFDVDGVLGDTEGPVCRATMKMFEDLYGITMKPEDFTPFIGTGAVRYVEGPAEKYGLKIDTDRACNVRHENFVKIIESEPIAFPGVDRLLESVAAESDWRLGIATSSPGEKSRQTLKAAGIDATIFNAYIHGDMITHKKPHPEIYLAAATALDLPPQNCVVVEDAITGTQSAKAAGMTCLSVTNSFTAEELHEADCIVNSLEEVSLDLINLLVRGTAIL